MFPAGEEQGKSSPLVGRTQPAVVVLPWALPGDDLKRGCIPGALHWGRCRAARRGGAGIRVLAAPKEESGRASARATQTPLSSSKAAPAQWSWKRNS